MEIGIFLRLYYLLPTCACINILLLQNVGVDCTEIQGRFDLNVGKWNTAPCTYPRPYICEAPKGN